MTRAHELLAAQHRAIELGISGLVDGSGSRVELTDAIHLLRRHIHVEETFLFPAIEQAGERAMALARMRYDHGDMWPHISSAIALLDARADLDALMPDCEALLRLLHDHDAREEEAIYTATDRYREDAAHPPLATLCATLDVPSGWKCRYAPE